MQAAYSPAFRLQIGPRPSYRPGPCCPPDYRRPFPFLGLAFFLGLAAAQPAFLAGRWRGFSAALSWPEAGFPLEAARPAPCFPLAGACRAACSPAPAGLVGRSRQPLP